MTKTLDIPLWVHLVCLSITFFGWFALSYFFGARESFVDSIIGATVFTVFMAIVDGVIWGTTKVDQKRPK